MGETTKPERANQADEPLAVACNSGYGTFVLLVIAGQALYARIQAEKEARLPKVGPFYESEALWRLQEEQGRRGIVGAKLTTSLNGWYLRYDSGAQNFGIIANSRVRGGRLDGSYADCARAAKDWVAGDPTLRYAWVLESDLRDYDHQTGEYLKGKGRAA